MDNINPEFDDMLIRVITEAAKNSPDGMLYEDEALAMAQELNTLATSVALYDLLNSGEVFMVYNETKQEVVYKLTEKGHARADRASVNSLLDSLNNDEG